MASASQVPPFVQSIVPLQGLNALTNLEYVLHLPGNGPELLFSIFVMVSKTFPPCDLQVVTS